jgi:hypothetical protein
MRDRSDRYRVQAAETLNSTRKRIGSYLVEAGLLTTSQLDVALNDQRVTEQTTGTRMQLGEIIAARGWVKEQTIEYLMQKIIIPERRTSERNGANGPAANQKRVAPEKDTRQSGPPRKPAPTSNLIDEIPSSGSGPSTPGRREVPIAKPLPPVNSTDNDVNWVG